MGIGGIGIWQLLIVLLIVVMLFGSKRLKNLGSDLGDTIKGFRKSMGNEEKAILEEDHGQTITVKAHKLEEPTKNS
jgi:sec-independent protein translocase protein TatA